MDTTLSTLSKKNHLVFFCHAKCLTRRPTCWSRFLFLNGYLIEQYYNIENGLFYFLKDRWQNKGHYASAKQPPLHNGHAPRNKHSITFLPIRAHIVIPVSLKPMLKIAIFIHHVLKMKLKLLNLHFKVDHLVYLAGDHMVAPSSVKGWILRGLLTHFQPAKNSWSNLDDPDSCLSSLDVGWSTTPIWWYLNVQFRCILTANVQADCGCCICRPFWTIYRSKTMESGVEIVKSFSVALFTRRDRKVFEDSGLYIS